MSVVGLDFVEAFEATRPTPALSVGLVRSALLLSDLRGDPSDSRRRGCAPTDPAGVGVAEVAFDRGYEAFGAVRPAPALTVGLVRSAPLSDDLSGDPSDSRRRGCAPTDAAEVSGAEFALDEGHEGLRTELKLRPYGRLAALGNTDLGGDVPSSSDMDCVDSEAAGVGVDERHEALWTELELRLDERFETSRRGLRSTITA